MTNLTPTQIFKEFDQMPPLQRPRLTEHLQGETVDWSVRLANAWQNNDETVRVAFRYGPPTVQSIIGNVRRSDYPQLEHLQVGESLRVRGRIRLVSTLWIELDITELLFCIETVAV